MDRSGLYQVLPKILRMRWVPVSGFFDSRGVILYGLGPMNSPVSLLSSLVKRRIIFAVLTFGVSLYANSGVTIYTYDSLSGKGSLGAVVKKIAEEKLGIPTNFVLFPNAGEALNQVAIEGVKTKADLVLGVDSNWLGRARDLKLFEPIDNKLFEPVASDLVPSGARDFLPFDYGYLAFLHDSRRTKAPKPGLSLVDFVALPELKNKVIIQDPRTSSIGFSFLLWSHMANPNEASVASFWKTLSGSLITVTPGWSQAYGMFMKQKADWVLSYTTSPAYHVEEEKLDAIQAYYFNEGHYRQVEGAMVVKGRKNAAVIQKWLELLLSKEVQEALPKTQWMYPVRKEVTLPESFKKLPVPKGLALPPESIETNRKKWIQSWTSSMTQGK